MRPLVLLVLLAAALTAAACRSRSQPVHHLDRLEVVGATAEHHGPGALEPADLRRLLEKHLSPPSFVRLESGKSAPEGAPIHRVKLELGFMREASRPEGEGSWAEVGATLHVQARAPSSRAPGTSWEIAGFGEQRVEGDSLEDRRSAILAALEQAVSDAVEGARLQLDAHAKPDDALVKELSASDERVRRSALRTLVFRRHPAAGPRLIEQLASEELREVRMAMGALVEMREKRAVEPLIELARGRDPGFERELLFAIAEIGGDEAKAYLFTVAQGHDHPAVRAAAKEAFEQLAATGKSERGRQ